MPDHDIDPPSPGSGERPSRKATSGHATNASDDAGRPRLRAVAEVAARTVHRHGGGAVYVIADRGDSGVHEATHLSSTLAARGLRVVQLVPPEAAAAAHECREPVAAVVDLSSPTNQVGPFLAARLDAPLIAAAALDHGGQGSSRTCRAVGLRTAGTDTAALSSAVFTAEATDDLSIADVDGRVISPGGSRVAVQVRGRLLEVTVFMPNRTSYTFVPGCRIASAGGQYELSIDGAPSRPYSEPTVVQLWTRTVTAQLVQA
jgi:hypothetical protein